MGRADYLKLGDWNAVCFQCGFKRKASYLQKNWQGYWVCPEHNEPRQVQDFARAVPDNEMAPWVQPLPSAIYTYLNQSIGFGDNVTKFFQLGDGLYTTTVTNVSVNGITVGWTDNGKGGITLASAAPSYQRVTASGTETAP